MIESWLRPAINSVNKVLIEQVNKQHRIFILLFSLRRTNTPLFFSLVGFVAFFRNGELTKTSDALRIPDDCTLGFVVSNRLSVNLTQSDLLHSHLERLKEIQFSSIKEQVRNTDIF